MDDFTKTFIIIPESIQRIREIDWPHRAIWGIIHAFSHNGGTCWLSVDQIAERIHRKRRQTSSMIQKLIDLELIEVVSYNGHRRMLRTTGKFEVPEHARNSAHVQSAAHQSSGKPRTSQAENRAPVERKIAHIENKLTEKTEQNSNPDEKKLVPKKSMAKSTGASGQKPESIEACRAYFAELNSNDADAFFDYWESVGWKRRTGKIVCWKSTARNWVRRSKNTPNAQVDKNKPFDAGNAFQWATK
jgi:hypothetical protein